MLEIIKASVWGKNKELPPISIDVYNELRLHALSTIPAPILPDLLMSDELRDRWKKEVLLQIAKYVEYNHAQFNIDITVPYVILKGTSAAQYYPHPEYRTMGDIDIMTKREDYNIAYNQLVENGYCVSNENEREIVFQKNGITIELHKYFASLNDPQKAEYLDDLILANITSSHVLPDMINGLVLLEHISQHMEHGIGLRQIVDWMMFVDKCLQDEKWPTFVPLAENIGLKKLAIVITKMCEIYLGLPERKWAEKADKKTCRSLMEFVMSCGNFGNKWTSNSDKRITIFSYSRSIVSAIKWLQERGLENWKAAQEHAILRPFAWIYQGGRCISRGFDGTFSVKLSDYRQAKKRLALFDELEVKQRSKGLVIYKDGKYKKKQFTSFGK